MDTETAKNHELYLERKALYKTFGYDVDQERGFVLEQAKPLDGKIVEAGTGKGHFALCLAAEGRPFVTFDISPEEQSFARLNLAYFGLDHLADFRIENAEHTGFADQSFDIILSVNVLHHLSDPYKVLDEFIRITSAHGKIVLADFTDEGFKIMDRIHGLEGKTHEVGKVGLNEAQAYFIQKGFSVKKTRSAYQCVLVASRKSS
ncbi:MAG TPA: class I SAM-dependent methyltransferase [Candidatus Omnitrophota bacterium]|nr:class I SAM-dependent methyltransferase [Candidatus Omnitrophota bacterium]HNQ50399.1 class I SAM-dependent methyltransferase [Candidatus Omnitrophota bacterium]HQO37705.1 class I SAM-dependent methyltransferase [Candidatus Omnitrophota bacterium]HQQ05952.1 class I SAM-dependent methyltransferase [Candidatus Omnitrophota bacterium]